VKTLHVTQANKDDHIVCGARELHARFGIEIRLVHELYKVIKY